MTGHKHTTYRVTATQSPGAKRIEDFLKRNGPSEIPHIAEGAFVSLRHCLTLLSVMRKQGRVMVSRWRPTSGGFPAKVFSLGFGPEPLRPPKGDKKLMRRQSYYRNKARWVDLLGEETAVRVLRSMRKADNIVIDGKVVYQKRRRATVPTSNVTKRTAQ